MKIFSPDEAVKHAYKLMLRNGFIPTCSKTKESTYFMKPGYRGRKIRISNHKTFVDLHQDVAANVWFDSNTIINDIEFRVNQAIKQYQRFKRKAS